MKVKTLFLFFFIVFLSSKSNASIVSITGGKDNIWPPAQAMNLTYCIDRKSLDPPSDPSDPKGYDEFGYNYYRVVWAMDNATWQWESRTNVNFVHLESLDLFCTPNNSRVVFRVTGTGVSYANINGWIAKAFFPNSPIIDRNLQINLWFIPFLSPEEGYVDRTNGLSFGGVLLHELGHVLGLRHEHIRPEGPGFRDPATCLEDLQWRALTGYDPFSVMHYSGSCNFWTYPPGGYLPLLHLTLQDTDGIQKLYGVKGASPLAGGAKAIGWLPAVLNLLLD